MDYNNLSKEQLIKKIHQLDSKVLSYENTLDNSPVATIVCDELGIIEYVNETVIKVLSITEELLIGQAIYELDIFSKEDYNYITKYIDTMPEMATIEYFTFPYQQSSLCILYKSIIKSNYITHRVFNILNHKKLQLIQQAAVEKELFLKNVQDIAEIGSWYWNLKTYEMQWSDQTDKIFENDSVANPPSFELFTNFISPHDRERTVKAMMRTIDSKEKYSMEHKIITNSGLVKNVISNARGVYNSRGQLVALFGAIQDISLQITQQDNLLEALHITKNMLYAIDTGIMVFDKYDTILNYNDNFNRIASLDKESYVDKTQNEIIKHFINIIKDSTQFEKIIELSRKEKEFNYSLELNLVNEHIIELRIKRYKVREHQYRYLWHVKDITDCIITQNQLIVYNNNLKYAIKSLEDNVGALKDEKKQVEEAHQTQSMFLANISHELRSPLNSIIGYSDLLIQEDINKKQKTYAENIHIGGSNLLDFINDILDFTKISSNSFDIINEYVLVKYIVIEIQRVFAYQAESQGIELIVDVENLIPNKIFIDDTRFRQILTNLVSNAIKFTSKGFVKVIVSSEYINDEYCSLHIEVQDSGIGIAENQQEKIFKAFCQSVNLDINKYGGTGLGLAITKKLSELMDGTINLKSEFGKGTSFTVDFDKIKYEIIAGNNLVEGISDLSGKRLLIITPNKDNSILMDTIQILTNIEILYCQNIDDVNSKIIEFNPSIIFEYSKIMNANSKNYINYITKSELYRHIPIICLTYQRADDIIEELEEYYDAIINLPVENREFIKILVKYLLKENDTINKHILLNTKKIKFDEINQLSEKDIKIIDKYINNIADEVNRINENFILSEIINIIPKLKLFAEETDLDIVKVMSVDLLKYTEEYNIDALLKIINTMNEFFIELKEICKK